MNTSTLASQITDQHKTLMASLPGRQLPWLVEMRERAYDRLRNRGLPTVKHEEWRYTDLKRLHEQVYASAKSATGG